MRSHGVPQHLDVCVVGGCGHVGLPLALTFARSGLNVGIYDTDEAKLAEVEAGRMPFREAGAPELLADALASGRLTLSSHPSILKESDAVVIVVGTPIDEFMNPCPAVIDRVIDEVSPWISEGALVVLRSTVYPGTSERVTAQLAEGGIRADVAFCPERIAEGHAIEELASLPQVIGAETDRAYGRAAALFANLEVPCVRTTMKEAELAKLFTNSWRYLKFAMANQLFMIATEADVDYERVLHAIRHDYPRAADLPGPGFAGGPCLLKDTMQLSAFTAGAFPLGQAAMLINEGLPEFLVRQLEKTVTLKGSVVAVLGMAFKAESDDVRGSLSYKLKEHLALAGASVVCTDPYVDEPGLVPLDTALSGADVVVIATPHRRYAEVDFGDKTVIDIWGLTSGASAPEDVRDRHHHATRRERQRRVVTDRRAPLPGIVIAQ